MRAAWPPSFAAAESLLHAVLWSAVWGAPLSACTTQKALPGSKPRARAQVAPAKESRAHSCEEGLCAQGLKTLCQRRHPAHTQWHLFGVSEGLGFILGVRRLLT